MNDKDIYSDIGYIKGKVEAIDDKVGKLNDKVAANCKKLQRHEVVLGKFGMVFAGIIFVASAGVNVVFNFIKDKLIK